MKFSTAAGRTIFGASLLMVAMAAVPASAGTPQADANVRLVKTFLAAVRTAAFQHHDPKEIRAVAERYMRPDYVQHSDDIKPGRDGYVEYMAAIGSGKAPMAGPMPSPQDLYWVADGDKVVWVSSIQLPGKAKPEFMFNMMRVQDGKIAEHWGK